MRVLRVAAVLTVVFVACAQESPSGRAVEKISHVHGLGLMPGDADGLYVATHFGLFARTGGTWARRSADKADHMGFTVGPNGVLFRSGHPEGGGNLGVQVSRDEGRTWQTASAVLNPPVDFHAMTARPSTPSMLYGWAAGRGILRSPDEGNRWEPAHAEGLPQAVGALAASADGTVYASTNGGLYRSTDAADNWEKVSDTLVFALALGGGSLFASNAQGPGVMRSTDGGASWQETALEAAAMVALAVSENGETVVAADQRAGIYRSTDGGGSWSVVPTP